MTYALCSQQKSADPLGKEVVAAARGHQLEFRSDCGTQCETCLIDSHVGSMSRSRRTAEALAKVRLESTRIGDEDVLAVLRLWYFKHNTTRTNVFPEGVTSVQSDTLGIVRTRTGSVVTTRLTKKWPYVFQLFCRWLSDNYPKIYTQPFPFTSISVNHGYAARKHRDGYNAGPRC